MCSNFSSAAGPRWLAWLLFGLTWLRCPAPASAQGENNHWCFGTRNGLSFTPAGAVARSSSIPNGFEANATVSDAWGNLLFYTDGQTIWNQQHQPMPASNGRPFRQPGHFSSQRGSLICKQPGAASRFLLFTTDAIENQFANGLRYSEIDMSLGGGLGAVTATQNVPLPLPVASLFNNEGVAGVQHANRRDVWVVAYAIVGTRQDLYAFLVTPAGVAPTPVISSGQGGGFVRFAPNGRQAACQQGNGQLLLVDFDAATGRFSNAQSLDTTAFVMGDTRYGVEFSPDGSKLYRYTQFSGLVQYDLQAGSLTAIRRSRQAIAVSARDNARTLEAGPDGRLYSAWNGLSVIGVVERPNARGAACQYQYSNFHGGTLCLQNLVKPQPPLADFAVGPACAGTPVTFQPTVPLPPGSGTVTWTLATAAGWRDSVRGTTATYVFAQPGLYQVTLSFAIGGHRYQWPRLLTVQPSPTLRLNLREATLCPGSTLQLRATARPAGTRLRWSDGSTDSTLTITGPGRYWVEARNAQGCARTDTAVVTDAACLIPTIITPNGDPLNETFRLRGFNAAEWTLEVYNRWGRQVYRRVGYDNGWNAPGQPAGVYYYLLTHPASGRHYRGYVEVMR